MATKISERAHGGGMHNNDLGKPGFAKAYSFGIVTAILFLLSWAGQFIAQIVHERNEARRVVHVGRLLASVSGLDPGIWQSEFLQMVWQAVGLALLFLWARRSPWRATSGSRPSSTGCSRNAVSIPTR
jgi:hypothetical protein